MCSPSVPGVNVGVIWGMAAFIEALVEVETRGRDDQTATVHIRARAGAICPRVSPAAQALFRHPCLENP